MWVALCCGNAIALAQAPPPGTVVIGRVPGDDDIVIRLRAELSSYRFQVLELSARPGMRTPTLAELAARHEARAAVRAKPAAMAAELWVSGNGAEHEASEELVSAGPTRDPEVLAMRVTEAMRARGLVLPQPQPLAAEAAPTAAAPEAAAARASARTPETIIGSTAEPLTPLGGPGEAGAVAPTRSESAGSSSSQSAAAHPERGPNVPAQAPGADSAAREASAPAPSAQNGTQAKPKAAAATTATTATTITASHKPQAGGDSAEPSQELKHAARRADSSAAIEKEEEERGAGPSAPHAALLYLELGPTGVWSPGANRVGPALDALLSVRFRPYPTSSISLVGLIPLLSTNVHHDGASLAVQTFGVGGFGDLHLAFERFELSGGLGALALFSKVLVTSLSPGTQFTQPDTDVPTQRLLALLGRVGIGWSLTPELRLSASVMGGLAVRELRIEANVAAGQPDYVVATWGRPLLFGTLSAELALPWDR